MKSIAGGLVVLTGGVMLTGGTLADALLAAANRTGSPGALIQVLGGFVGLVGFGMLMTSASNHQSPSLAKELPPKL